MAARSKRVTLDEPWREKIKTSMLINRLQDDGLGKIQLTDGQRASIKILLGKTAPDLQAVKHEHSGAVGVTVEIVKFADTPPS